MPDGDVSSAGDDKQSLDDLIADIGFGRYQVHAYAFFGGFMLAEGAAITATSGNVIAMSDNFDIANGFNRSFLMTSTFTGLALGTLLSGPLGDFLGRRWTVLIAYCGMAVIAVAISVNDAPLLVYFDNVLLGTFCGLGIPVCFIAMAEITPLRLRGVCTAAAGSAFVFGELWAAFGLWCFNPDLKTGMWRQLILWAAIPSVLLTLVGLVNGVARNDTPQWLALKKGTKAATEVINLMARMNGASEQSYVADYVVQSKSDSSDGLWARWSMIVSRRYGLYTLVLCIIFFMKDLIFYGSSVFWPRTWAHLHTLNAMSPATKLMLTAGCAVPGFGLAMLLMYVLPRRLAYSGACCIVAVASGCMMNLSTDLLTGLIGSFVFRMFFPTMMMLTLLLPSEIFPIEIRGLGFSLAALFGRAATVAAPAIVSAPGNLFLVLVSSGTAIVALLVYLLPETSHVGLTKGSDSATKCISKSEDSPFCVKGETDYTGLKA